MMRILFLLLILCAVSCVKENPPKPALTIPPQTAPETRFQPESGTVPNTSEQPPAVEAEQPSAEQDVLPLAILKSGTNPLWFELERENRERKAAQGPFQIAAPSAASLAPFTPWTQAIFAAGMVMHSDRLVIGINRAGFLMVAPQKDGSLALYRSSEAYWENYTICSMFIFEEQPAVLLYRDAFFVDPAEKPPSPKVFAHISGKPKPVGVTLRAFEAFPAEAGWDIDALRQGPDGYWYYRGVLRASAEGQPKAVYCRSPGLSLAGETVSLSAFRNSALPASLKTAPTLLQEVLDTVFRLAEPDLVPIAEIISPEFLYSRYFTREPSLASAGQRLLELTGYYCQTGPNTAQALAVLPDGRGAAGKSSGGKDRVEPIALPALPEGFVYTGIALAGDTLVGTWEEQQDMSVGAAGLMVIRFPQR
jgi:hypothetical protein